jgi:hypothetical protein
MTDEMDRNLPFGSESLTREEEALRNELVEWCKAKLRKGHRPVPLFAAMQIFANWARDPDKHGLR